MSAEPNAWVAYALAGGKARTLKRGTYDEVMAYVRDNPRSELGSVHITRRPLPVGKRNAV